MSAGLHSCWRLQETILFLFFFCSTCYLLVLRVFLVTFQFFYMDDYVSCKERLLFCLISSFQVFIPFLSFFFFFFFWSYCSSQNTSSTNLEKSNDKEHPCFVPSLCGKTSSFSLLSMMLTVVFMVDILYQVEEVPLYSQFTTRF